MKDIIAAVPASINKLLAGAIAAGQVPHYSPGLDHTLMQCGAAACGQDVWVGPKSLARLKAAPDQTELRCMPCALADVAPDVDSGLVVPVIQVGQDPEVRRT